MSTCTRRAIRRSAAKRTPCRDGEVEGLGAGSPQWAGPVHSSPQSGGRVSPWLCRAVLGMSKLEGEGCETLKLWSRSPFCRMPPGRLTHPRKCPTLSAISATTADARTLEHRCRLGRYRAQLKTKTSRNGYRPPPKLASWRNREMESTYLAVIKVVGAGGGGTNAVSRMVDAGIRGVEFVAVNTDAQALQACDADIKLSIGQELTRGLGAGGNPEVGAGAAAESRDEIKEALKGADMVFVTAGEGGGTGTGSAPVIAEIAKEEIGALTVGAVTKPFEFEGKRRMQQALEGIEKLRNNVDTLIIVPNEKLLQAVERRTSVLDAFRQADDILRQGVQGITDLITIPGLINLDFADVRTIMRDA